MIKEWAIKQWNRFKNWIKGLAVVISGILLAQVVNPSIERKIINKIEASQDAYFQEHGIYWQGLKTHTFLPDKDETLDNLSIKPFYQEEGWNDLIEFPNELPFQVEVHQYKTPQDKYGYQIFLRYEKDNKRYVKSIGYGVEAEHRTFEIVEEISTLIATTTK